MYQFLFSSHFQKKYKKLVESNFNLDKKLESFFLILEVSPFEIKLKTHKVISKSGDTAWSSRITQDLRIIWDFNKDNPKVIDLLDIGGHSGKRKVYK